jgi:hypothetical protein
MPFNRIILTVQSKKLTLAAIVDKNKKNTQRALKCKFIKN